MSLSRQPSRRIAEKQAILEQKRRQQQQSLELLGPRFDDDGVPLFEDVLTLDNIEKQKTPDVGMTSLPSADGARSSFGGPIGQSELLSDPEPALEALLEQDIFGDISDSPCDGNSTPGKSPRTSLRAESEVAVSDLSDEVPLLYSASCESPRTSLRTKFEKAVSELSDEEPLLYSASCDRVLQPRSAPKRRLVATLSGKNLLAAAKERQRKKTRLSRPDGDFLARLRTGKARTPPLPVDDSDDDPLESLIAEEGLAHRPRGRPKKAEAKEQHSDGNAKGKGRGRGRGRSSTPTARSPAPKAKARARKLPFTQPPWCKTGCGRYLNPDHSEGTCCSACTFSTHTSLCQGRQWLKGLDRTDEANICQPCELETVEDAVPHVRPPYTRNARSPDVPYTKRGKRKNFLETCLKKRGFGPTSLLNVNASEFLPWARKVGFLSPASEELLKELAECSKCTHEGKTGRASKATDFGCGSLGWRCSTCGRRIFLKDTFSAAETSFYLPGVSFRKQLVAFWCFSQGYGVTQTSAVAEVDRNSTGTCLYAKFVSLVSAAQTIANDELFVGGDKETSGRTKLLCAA